MASPGESETGSLLQGVSRFDWLLPAQVYPEPDSETRNPKRGLETTLIQGAGGSPGPEPAIVMRYSRPSGVKPPEPLKNCKLVGAGLGGCGRARSSARFDFKGGGRAGTRSRRSSWLTSGPVSPAKTTRAAASRRVRSASVASAALRTKTPP